MAFPCAICHKSFTYGVRPENSGNLKLSWMIENHCDASIFSNNKANFWQSGLAKTALDETIFDSYAMGDEPCSCSYCHLKFRHKETVKLHEKKHREKPYWCETCRKGFIAVILSCNIKKLNFVVWSPLSDPNLLSKSTYKCEHCEARLTS